ncbi:MAG: relaxase/mobilization nuclease domain-containing protein [Nitrobacter sp.]
MTGRGGLKDMQERWVDDALLDNRRRRDGSLSVNMILSMPAGTEPGAVKDAVRAFAIETFEHNYDYVFVQHVDDKHPHVHLTVQSLGHDGKRLNPRKADLQAWREWFARELRLRGIAAEATPRRTRGKVRRADRAAVLAMRKRKIIPDVDRFAREEVVREARSGKTAEPSWEERIRSRQRAIRRCYLAYASELERSATPRDQALALQIRQFVGSMPPVETRRQMLKKELSELVRGVRRDTTKPDRRRNAGDRERDK